VAFYSALYNRQLLAVREKQREHLNENVSSQQGRYRAGLVNRGALMAADSQAREVDPLVEGARRAYSGAQLQLAQSMALDVKSDDALPNPEGELRFAHVDVDVPAATATALQERTDIKLARLLVRAANEDERIIAAGYCPAVNGSVTGDYIPVTGIHREGSTSRVDDFLGSEVREGAALSWQVIDNGKVSGPLIRQRKAREINEVELHKLETGVGRELARIRNDLLGIEAKHNSLVSGSQNARRAATAIQENLSSGLSSELEYRVAESSALKTESGLLEASYLQNVSLAEWDRATGRYFQFIEDMR
jgi:outer membrane protein TolC